MGGLPALTPLELDNLTIPTPSSDPSKPGQAVKPVKPLQTHPSWPHVFQLQICKSAYWVF